MNYFLDLLERHKFIYIIIISLIATVLIVNSTLEFTERVINNHLLLILSLVIFYFLTSLAIRKETRRI